jgi:RES domain-containing protein
MIVYRLASKKYSNDLSGAGAALHGGRWNKKGTPVLYTGESKEIALLETIVHIPPMIIPKLDVITLDIPDDSIKTLEIEMLPVNWSNYPAPTVLSEIGQQWVNEADKLALRVPSCIIHSAYNILLNCLHIRYSEVIIIDKSDFKFDFRLIK